MRHAKFESKSGSDQVNCNVVSNNLFALRMAQLTCTPEQHVDYRTHHE